MRRPIRQGEEIIGAVVGGSKCGKTTLARGLVAGAWAFHGLRSIVFDPFKARNQWPASAWVTSDLDAFKRAVWNTSGCCVVWDESSDSIEKNAKEDRRFFTRIRHEHRAFFILCHDLFVLSTIMRANLTDAYIFRQPEERADEWRKLFADASLRQTADLQRREFVHKVAFEPPRRRLPTVEEIACVPLIGR